MFISVNRCEIGTQAGKTAVSEVMDEFGIRAHPLVTVQDIYEYVKGCPEYAESIPLMEQYMQPVSYTHLDVYKRQPDNHSFFYILYSFRQIASFLLSDLPLKNRR